MPNGLPQGPGEKPVGAPVLEPDTDTVTRLAPLYRVLIHNDEVTPMGFVVQVLRQIFHLSLPKSFEVMVEAHNTGTALVGVYPLERAEFLVDRAHAMARTAKYPLSFSYEPEEVE